VSDLVSPLIFFGDFGVSFPTSPRGTLYGVYTFLETWLGVRFLTADPPM